MQKANNDYKQLAELCKSNTSIPSELYAKYDVKKGLRDINGNGVLAGLTNISFIESYKNDNGVKTPCDGRLLYRGININDLVNGVIQDKRKGYEEIAYLLLFGKLPYSSELDHFKTMISEARTLPKNFVRDVVMKAPSKDMMNTLSKSVLMLASYDNKCDDLTLNNVLFQCMRLISVFPLLAVYGYHAYNHYINDESMYIHKPDNSLSTAENILRLLRPDKSYTELEATVLDIALILHMEHGGGNNSTFTTHVVSSSGTDTYSVIAAALGSLKGPKHGGAN
ncbi:MAG: citrate/2-methylcitrate synthase, partial [Clostridia bacterium]